MTELLSGADREDKLAQCLENGWVLIDKRDAIYKKFKFFLMLLATLQGDCHLKHLDNHFQDKVKI